MIRKWRHIFLKDTLWKKRQDNLETTIVYGLKDITRHIMVIIIFNIIQEKLPNTIATMRFIQIQAMIQVTMMKSY